MKPATLLLTWVLAGPVLLPLGSDRLLLASPAPQNIEQPSTKDKTVKIRIAGMTCAACAKGLEASFRHMAGVAKAGVDYEHGEAIIIFDPAKQTIDSLSKFIASCGYQVKEARVI